jgi:hypothetical protein
MRVLLLYHPYVYPRFEQDFMDRVAELPAFNVRRADLAALSEGRLAGEGKVQPLAAYDAIIVFVAFNALRRAPQLDWQGFSGPRLLFDHDVIHNYSSMFDAKLNGLWGPEFRRHRFDVIVTSGGAVRRLLSDEGIAADWLPKAFEASRFADREGPRSGVVSYGSAYPGRKIAECALREAGTPVERLDTTPYPDLPGELTRYLAGMAVSTDITVPRSETDAMPAREVGMRTGLEPMAKYFECAGSGCCPVSDAMEDLAALGFTDGVNAITFSSHGELVDRMRWWLARPEVLREMGRAAARHVHAHHTWRHRAAELAALVRARLGSQSI